MHDFLKVLETTINSLDKGSIIEQVTTNLGGIHAKLNDSRGFDPYVWGVFIECTLFCFRRHFTKVGRCVAVSVLSL